MIDTVDKLSAVKKDNKNNNDTTPRSNNDLPPPYAGPSTDGRTSTPVPVRKTRPAPNVPASNFVTVKRVNHGISEFYVLDTQLRVPTAFLSCSSKSEEGEHSSEEPSERPNLHLESAFGWVDVDIWLVRGRGNAEPGGGNVRPIVDDRALINVRTENSSIDTKLRCETEQPYILRCSSSHGSISVWLPPSFVGPATVSTASGRIFLSPAFQKRCTTFSEVNGVRTCFIGDYESSGFQSISEWKGSVLELTSSTSSINVYSIEELQSEISWSKKQGSKFSLSKLFSCK